MLDQHIFQGLVKLQEPLSNVITGHLSAPQACMPCVPAYDLFSLSLWSLLNEKIITTIKGNP